MDETISVYCQVKPFSFEKLNENFTLCKCYVMALGKNANRSYFAKEAVDNALSTLPYVPTVAHLMYDAEAKVWHVGGHDVALDDDYNFVRLDMPYGVVVDDSFEYVEVVEKGGAVNTYLTCSIILWTGLYPDLMKAAYSDECFFGQSMEIRIKESQALPGDKNYREILDFEFNCLTLLGKSDNEEYNVTPCFPSACVVPFSINTSDNYQEFYQQMINQVKALGISVKFSRDETKNIAKETTDLNEKINLLAQFGLTIDDIDFSIEDMELEELNTKLTAEYSQETPPETDPVEGDPTEGSEGTEQSFQLNIHDQWREVASVVEGVTYEDGGVVRRRYYLEDLYSDRAIVSDVSNGWRYYQIPVSWNADSPVVDFESPVRVKRDWSAFEEGSTEPMVPQIIQAFQDIEAESADKDAKYAELEIALNEKTTSLDEMSSKYQELVDGEKRKAREELFEQFEKELSGVERFEALREDSEIEPEELRKELFAMVGEKKFSFIEEKPAKPTTKFGRIDREPATPYGGLIEKYKK